MWSVLAVAGVILSLLCSSAFSQQPTASRPVAGVASTRPSPVAPKNQTPEKTNNALLFGRPGSEIRLDQTYTGGDFTLEAWVRPDKITRGGQRLCPIVGNLQQERGVGLGHMDGFWIMRAWTNKGGDSQARSATPVQIGQTVHIAGVLDDREIRLYIDGKLVDRHVTKDPDRAKPTRRAQGQGQGQFRPSGLPFLIGTDPTGAGVPDAKRVFHGVIDEVRISIGARYIGPSFRPQRSLTADAKTLALLHFDEGSGVTTANVAPRGKPLTIHAADWVAFEIPELPKK